VTLKVVFDSFSARSKGLYVQCDSDGEINRRPGIAGQLRRSPPAPGVKIVSVLATCSECGMPANVTANETMPLDPPSRCAHKGKPLACPKFKDAVSGAHQILRKV
jgi:hypothetical protein